MLWTCNVTECTANRCSVQSYLTHVFQMKGTKRNCALYDKVFICAMMSNQ